jgi:hypothetical protein
MPKPNVTKAKFDNDRLNGSSSSTGWLKGTYLGVGYRVAVHYRSMVWLGTITGPASGGKWPFQVFPTAYLNISPPRSDMITVTVTNPGGQTSDPTNVDPQPAIVP